nr:hypothetical protein HmN_000292300 [Hymenolepis microstoma]
MLAAQCSLNAVKVIGYKVETCNGDYEAAAVRGKQHNRRFSTMKFSLNEDPRHKIVIEALQMWILTQKADVMLTSAFLLQDALRLTAEA